MPKRKSPYPDKPWHPDRAKWAKLVARMPDPEPEPAPPTEPEWKQPKGGWMLYRWDTLEDAKQE